MNRQTIKYFDYTNHLKLVWVLSLDQFIDRFKKSISTTISSWTERDG